MDMYKPDGSSIGVHFDAYGNSYFNPTAGGLGIGMTNPSTKLVVDGILTISQSSSGGDHHLEGLKIIRATIGAQYMRLNQQGGATHLVSYVEGGGTRGSINLMGHNAATGTPVSYLHLSQNSAGTGGVVSGSATSTDRDWETR